MKNLASVDLNLLVAFDALITERHVTRAAEKVGLTQPALSHALRRLRELFDDDLLVRGPDGMKPTERAQAIHLEVSSALMRIRTTLSGPDTFDPSTAERTFHLAMSDSVGHLVLPRLLRRLRIEAPKVQLTVARSASMEGWQRVLDGDAELGIGVYTNATAGLQSQDLTLAEHRYAVVDINNPKLHDGKLNMDDYINSPHVAVSVDAGPGRPMDTVLPVLGFQRRIVVVLPSFSLVPAVIRGTDMVGHCSRFMVEHLDYRNELVLFDPPVPLPRDTVRAIWRRSRSDDAGLRWLIDLIANSLVH
ncbi:MAG: LysR family transcriptional regulator [Steroidobacteraceae bacterium]